VRGVVERDLLVSARNRKELNAKSLAVGLKELGPLSGGPVRGLGEGKN
jgi:hypothetical protein